MSGYLSDNPSEPNLSHPTTCSDDSRSERVHGCALYLSSSAPNCGSQPRVPLQVCKIHQVETAPDHVEFGSNHGRHGVGTRSARHVSSRLPSNTAVRRTPHCVTGMMVAARFSLPEINVLGCPVPHTIRSVAGIYIGSTFSTPPSRAGLATIASRAIPSL